MLTEEEKKEIQRIFRQELRKELKALVMRKIEIDRGPRKQGDPEKRVVEEEWNVIDFLAGYLPHVEGALRGLQEDLDKTKNEVSLSSGAVKNLIEGLGAVSGILTGLEKPILALGQLAESLKMIEGPKKHLVIDLIKGDR